MIKKKKKELAYTPKYEWYGYAGDDYKCCIYCKHYLQYNATDKGFCIYSFGKKWKKTKAHKKCKTLREVDECG